MLVQQTMQVKTRGRGLVVLTGELQMRVAAAGVAAGLCHVFLQHTSASLCLTENADPVVRADLERWLQRVVPDGDPVFQHSAEGPDDMPAHVRSLLFGYELTLPIRDGELALGTWQGVYLWEHRWQGQQRNLLISLMGEP